MTRYETIDMPIWRDRTIPAEIVDVAPHLPATFAVHREPDGRPSWRVSNVETGYFIQQSEAKTREGAVRKARAFLATVKPEVIERQLAKCARVDFADYITPASQRL